MVYGVQQKYDKAKEYYQKALKINPTFAPAANNLAYLYTEKGGNVDEALNLAQSAKEQFPDDLHISDALVGSIIRRMFLAVPLSI
jgi:tetratricopeptide (TPR) repeat protein